MIEKEKKNWKREKNWNLIHMTVEAVTVCLLAYMFICVFWTAS